MSRSPRASRRALLAGFLLAFSTLAIAPFAPPADAHGSTQEPASRAYMCRFDQPDNPMCAAAWSANSQALYDWMEVNIGDAAGRHRQLIPDGQLCSAGRAKYGALDRPGAWPVTALRADGSGLVDLVYENTAPHSTEYYRVYITKTGFDARTDALAWNDLELVYDSGRLERSARQVMRAPIPERAVPAILYIVWQRSDSPEAFYACSDVTVTNGSPGTTTPPTTTVTTAPPTTRATTPTTRPATSAPTSRPTAPRPTTPQTTVVPSSSQATTARPSTPPSSATRPAPRPSTSTAPSGSATASSQAATGSSPSVVVVTTGPADQRTSTSEASSTESTSSDGVSSDSDGAAGLGTAPPTSASPLAASAPRSDQAETDLDADGADTAPSADVSETAAGPVDAGSSSGGRWLLLGGAVGLGSLGLVLVGFGLGAPDWRRRGVDLLRGLGDGPLVLGLPSSRPAPPTDHYDVRHVGERP